jgi:hypothetical protein
MNVVLWIAAGLLALAFLAAGGMKLAKPKADLAKSGMGWTDDFNAGQVKAIGGVEVLGSLGVILPGVLKVATVLVPLAATGLGLTMIGAAIEHLRRKENKLIGGPVVLLLLAAFVAWGRFGTDSL